MARRRGAPRGLAEAALLALFVLLAPMRAHAEPPGWSVDPAASAVTFVARQMAVEIEGRFERFTADIRFDPAEPAASRAVVEIDVASVRTANRDVEAEIKKPKWFDVAAHPKARFEATTFRALGGDRFEAVGTLTLKGVRREVVLPFTLIVAGDPENAGMLFAKAAGEVEVRRLDFGIGEDEWRSTAIVADEVAIRIALTARRPR